MNNSNLKNKALADMPHPGNLIDNYLKEKRIFKSALARKLNVNIKTLIRVRSLNDLSISWLWSLSHAVKHNFIADIAVQLPSDYTGALQDALAEKDKTITTLQSELDAMTKERDIYKNLLKP